MLLPYWCSDYTPALNNSLNVDDTANTFAGTMNGRYKVYVDPYSANVAASQYYVVGYKGTSPYDAGFFYCPYVPLQMVRASLVRVPSASKIGFKTRYGMLLANPFAAAGAVAAGDTVNADASSTQTPMLGIVALKSQILCNNKKKVCDQTWGSTRKGTPPLFSLHIIYNTG